MLMGVTCGGSREGVGWEQGRLSKGVGTEM